MATQKKEDDMSMTRTFGKSLLCMAVATAMNPVYAQQTTDAEEAALEVIEVKGIRSSMAENLATKRLSQAVVDAITAEDIGKFPDKNVADSLQRVPGVVIQRDGGEGASVSIRGLSSDLTFTQLNGNFIASSPGEPSRSFDYTLLPSAMIKKVEVFKSSEARLDEGGVGGTVLLHTRKPFEMDANSGVLNIEATYADVTEDYEPQGTALYSWKNEEETLGFLVGFTKQDRTNRTLSGGTNANVWRWTGEAGNAVDANGNAINNNNPWAALNDATGNTYSDVYFPQVARTSVVKEDRQREGIQLTGQWRPTDRLEITANYFGFELGQDRTLSVIDIPEWSLSPNFISDVTLDEAGLNIVGIDYVVGAGGVENDMQFPWIRGTYTREESTSDTFDLGFEYEGDEFVANFKFGQTEAEGGPTENWEAAYKSSNWGQGDDFVENAAQYAGWSLGSDRLSMYMDPNTLNALLSGVGGAADPGSSGSSFVNSELEEKYAQLDLDIYVDWGMFHTIKTGAKYRKGELHRETGNNFFLDPDFDIAAAEATEDGIDVFDSYQWNGGMPSAEEVLNTSGEGNIAGGFDINLMPTINWEKYRDLVVSNYTPYTRIEDQFVYDIEEEIKAAYIQGEFDYADFRGNLGLRVVETTTTAASTDLYTYFLDNVDDETGEPVVGDDRFREQYELIESKNTYTEVLPSLNVVWDAGENLVVRLAAAKVMSRPGYSALGSQERVTFVSDEWASDRAEFNELPGFSGSGGNKELEPYLSKQFDISVEYYYGEGSAIGSALFYKKVDNFIVPLVIDRTTDYAGFEDIVPAGEITITPYSTSGNGSNAKSKGLELFIQHAFESGFGLYANYTRNITNKADVSVNGEVEGQSALVGSAKYQYNLSAYYETDDYSVRASWNKRGDTVLGLASGFNVYQDPYTQVDINASYSLTEDIIISASVVNLTEEESVSRLGNDVDSRLYGTSYAGRRFYIGATYSF
ncbi:TonB-dependent receptor [Alteromonas sp. ALT199]|uniref:TonB-dependent receptor n=1 Tax=unclassified Alteromonas TaxID=2614992 RepID=UPI001BEC97B1|nr:TonB-dependent receptor [Alteromonas sp. ALT199]MBT3136179.1 TonB-dependent receptor [Alteromonas sp. ALT199]